MAVAMVLYFTGFQVRPAGTTEHGEFYQPARPTPELSMTLPGEGDRSVSLRGKWTLIYVGDGACDPACQQALVEMRQVRRALGRDMDRVHRVFVVTAGSADGALLARDHPGLGVIADGAAVAALTAVTGPLAPGEIVLADPLGNLVLRYPAGTGMKGIHGDLKHLLKISTIG